MTTRRNFIKYAAAGAASLIGAAGGPRFTFAQEAGGKTFVKVFMRGGADGLHLFPKVMDLNYYSSRPNIGIEPTSNDSNSAIELRDPYTGEVVSRAMNPNLGSLAEIWDAGNMLVMPACGLAANRRSHFDSQRFIGNGADNNLIDGYLNRYMQEVAGVDSPLRGAVLGKGSLSTELGGALPVPVIETSGSFNVQSADFCVDTGCADNRLTQIMNEMVANEEIPLSDIASRIRDVQLNTLESIADVTAAAEGYVPDAGGLTYDGSSLGRGLELVAQLLKAGVPLEVAALDFQNGWDTHTNQISTDSNQFTDQDFSYHSAMRAGADNLLTFFRDMGPLMADVVVLVCTEFGRTVRENGSQGTDHGNASSWIAFGGDTVGGMADDVADLSSENLLSSRYVPLIQDYRDVAGEIMVRHLGMSESLVSTVFPQHAFSDNGFFVNNSI